MRRRPLVLGFAVLLVLLGACGDDGTATVASSTTTSSSAGLGELEGRAFVSTTITHELVDGTRVRLEFADGEVRANAGCNHLSGTATVDGDRLVVTNVGGTEMGCDRGLQTQDEWLAAFLQNEPTWTLDADSFTLFDGKDRIAMVDEETAEPDRALEGVLWVVNSLVDGDSVSSVPGSPEVEASMTFADGRVTGTDGCNRFNGPAAIADDTITFGELAMTRMACTGDRDALSRAFGPVLQGAVSYEIDADQLTLTTADGRGLVLGARD